jgi:two-component system, NtrC family, sensor histidine kinase HydH
MCRGQAVQPKAVPWVSRSSAFVAHMRLDHPKNSRRIRGGLLVVLALATAATLFSTYAVYRNALDAAEESLRLQALGIAASLEPSLASGIRSDTNLFPAIVAESSWPSVAFLALYDPQGVTLLHSNSDLIGRKVESSQLRRAAASRSAVPHHLTLGTGEEIFVLDAPVAVRGEARVLRIALHRSQTQAIVRHAVPQAMSIGAVVIALWALGVFFLRALRRAEDLNERVARRESLALLGEMAAVLAHEIRNPLGSIKGFAQYLGEKHPAGTPDADSLSQIVAEAGRLERLTEDLLLYARPAELRVGRFDVAELATKAAAAVGERAAASGHLLRCRVTIPENLMLLSDREKMGQILTNILQNAADALGEGGSMEVGGRVDGDHVVVVVKDDGCGMDAATQRKAFESFFTTKPKGTGLGLAIVARLVDVLRGTVSIESSVGNGSTVTLRLPLTSPGEPHG